MGKFVRYLDRQLIDALKSTPLYNKLFADVKSGKVFPAIRNNSIAFYYKGSLLFKFDKNGFQTHYKFLIDNSYGKLGDGPYVVCNGERDGKVKPAGMIIDNFYDGYESIKQTIGVYAKPEALLTSGFYKRSFLSDEGSKSRYVLLDIEVAFEKPNNAVFEMRDENNEDPSSTGKKSRKKLDRIDAVLYDTKKYQIVFCEVKRFDDDRLSSIGGKDPEVILQLGNYKTQIGVSEDSIVSSYNNAFKLYNELFGTQPLVVESVYDRAVLFVTGCDELLYKKGVEDSVKIITEKSECKAVFFKEAGPTALKMIIQAAQAKN